MLRTAKRPLPLRANRATSGLVVLWLLVAHPAGASSTLRAVGRIAIRGRDAGEIVAEIAGPSQIRVEIHRAGRAWLAGFDGEQVWAVEARSDGLHPAPVPAALVRAFAAIALEAAGFPPAGGTPAGGEHDVGGGTASLEGGRIRRWRGRLGAGARARYVEISFDGEIAAAGRAFPACIEVGEAGAAPEIVVDVIRVEEEPPIDPAWFSPPPSP